MAIGPSSGAKAGRWLCQATAQAVFELARGVGMGRRVVLAQGVPEATRLEALLGRTAEGLAGLVGDVEARLERPAQVALGGLDLVGPERRAVGLCRILLAGAAVADVGAHDDERRPGGLVTRRLDGAGESLEVVAVLDPLDVPAVGLVAPPDVLAEGEVGRAVDRDPVVVVEHDELAEPEVAGPGAGLGGHALHQVAVARQHPDAVVDDREAGAVEGGAEHAPRDGHADGVAEPLSQGAGGRLDAGRDEVLGVPRSA